MNELGNLVAKIKEENLCAFDKAKAVSEILRTNTNRSKVSKTLGWSRETLYQYLRISKTDYSNYPDHRELGKRELLRICKTIKSAKQGGSLYNINNRLPKRTNQRPEPSYPLDSPESPRHRL